MSVHTASTPAAVPPAATPAATLTVADLNIELHLPHGGLDVDFLGPTLRGLLGYGLREVACGHSSDAHGRCTCPARCDYAYIFEGAHPATPHALLGRYSSLPQPFRLIVPAPHAPRDPRSVDFTVRLFGPRAISLAPHIIDAIAARRRHGIGAREARFELARTTVGQPRTLRFEAAATPPRALEIRFLTPTMLRRSQRISAEACVTAADLAHAGRTRAWLLAHAYGSGATRLPHPHAIDGDLEAARSPTHGTHMLAPWRIRRQSGRQRRAVDLAGITGRCTINADWSAERWWLGALHEIGLGRHTTFGLGHVLLPAVEPSRTEPCARRARLPRWMQLRGLPPARPSSVPRHAVA